MILYAFLAKESIGKLFAAGLIPGLMLAGIYIVYILIISRIKPSIAPPWLKLNGLIGKVNLPL
nr:TRAP transporter large permease subunit [Nitrincola sp. A-D6]